MNADADTLKSSLDLVSQLDRVTNLFVPNPGQNSILLELCKLVDAPSSSRPVNIVLIAEPNFGKSETLKYFERKVNPEFSYTKETTEIPVVRVSMVDVQDAVGLLRTTLSSIGIRYSVRDPLDELWRRLKLHVGPLMLRVFVFDDAHAAAELREARQKELLKTFRRFGGITQRPIALAGAETLRSFIDSDREYRTRFIPLSIPAIASKSDLQRFLKGFDERLGLDPTSNLSHADTVALVHELVGLELGAVCLLIKHAAQTAIRNGSVCITPQLLKDAVQTVPDLQQVHQHRRGSLMIRD